MASDLARQIAEVQHPRLFSASIDLAHRAASPYKIETARTKAILDAKTLIGDLSDIGMTLVPVDEITALRDRVARTMSDSQRLIWRDDVEGICRSPDMCFEYGDHARCGPCSIDQAKACGIATLQSLPNLPEVSRLQREAASLRDRVAALEGALTLIAADFEDFPSPDHVKALGDWSWHSMAVEQRNIARAILATPKGLDQSD